MDPLSLTTRTAELATSVLQRMVREKGNLDQRSSVYEAVVRSEEDLEAVQRTLIRMGRALKGDSSIIDRLELGDAFQTVVGGCEVTLDCILTELGFMGQKGAGEGVRWGESEMSRLLVVLGRMRKGLRLLKKSLLQELPPQEGRLDEALESARRDVEDLLASYPRVATAEFDPRKSGVSTKELGVIHWRTQLMDMRPPEEDARTGFVDYHPDETRSWGSGSTYSIPPSKVYRLSEQEMDLGNDDSKDQRKRSSRPQKKDRDLYVVAGIGAVACVAAGFAGYYLAKREKSEAKGKEWKEKEEWSDLAY